MGAAKVVCYNNRAAAAHTHNNPRSFPPIPCVTIFTKNWHHRIGLRDIKKRSPFRYIWKLRSSVGRQPAREENTHTIEKERDFYVHDLLCVMLVLFFIPLVHSSFLFFLLHGKKRREEKKGKKMKRISETSLCGRELKSECSAPEALNPDVISPSHVIAVE